MQNDRKFYSRQLAAGEAQCGTQTSEEPTAGQKMESKVGLVQDSREGRKPVVLQLSEFKFSGKRWGV